MAAYHVCFFNRMFTTGIHFVFHIIRFILGKDYCVSHPTRYNHAYSHALWKSMNDPPPLAFPYITTPIPIIVSLISYDALMLCTGPLFRVLCLSLQEIIVFQSEIMVLHFVVFLLDVIAALYPPVLPVLQGLIHPQSARLKVYLPLGGIGESILTWESGSGYPLNGVLVKAL